MPSGDQVVGVEHRTLAVICDRSITFNVEVGGDGFVRNDRYEGRCQEALGLGKTAVSVSDSRDSM